MKTKKSNNKSFKFYLYGCPNNPATMFDETAFVGRLSTGTDWILVDGQSHAWKFEAISNKKAVEIAEMLSEKFDWKLHPVKTIS